MGIFEPDAETIGWGDKSIGARVPIYSPQIVKATDRIMILSGVKKRNTHFAQGLGYIKCHGGECCKHFGDPKIRLGAVCFVYETDREGNLLVDANGSPIVKGELAALMLTDNMYANFSSAERKAKAASEGTDTLDKVDCLISVESDHKKQWKQWDITLARRSYFLDFVKKGQTRKDGDGNEIPGDPKIKEWFQSLVPRMKDLWKKIGRELGREVSDEDVLDAVGKGAPEAASDQVPDVGDPTSVLDSL